MKVLFICRSNAGRSQCAEAFFNKYSKKNRGISAGLDVSKTRTAGIPPGRRLIEVMKDYKIDISRKKRKQLSRSMAEEASRIVILMRKAETKKLLPQYLKSYTNKTLFWDIKDMRHTKSHGPLIERTKKIDKLVRNLVKEIG